MRYPNPPGSFALYRFGEYVSIFFHWFIKLFFRIRHSDASVHYFKFILVYIECEMYAYVRIFLNSLSSSLFATDSKP